MPRLSPFRRWELTLCRGRIFRFDESFDAWVPADGQSISDGLATAFSPERPPCASINDADYLLAVVPDQFMSAAGSYRIAVDASLPQLAPASLAANASVTDLWRLAPKNPGRAEANADSDLAGVDRRLYRFRVPLESASPADVTISVDTSMFAPVISVYDASSRQLTHAASRRDAGRFRWNSQTRRPGRSTWFAWVHSTS